VLSRPSDHWNLFASTGLYTLMTMFPNSQQGVSRSRLIAAVQDNGQIFQASGAGSTPAASTIYRNYFFSTV
jgi:hypothetical protein